jgi:beta-galactosidase
MNWEVYNLPFTTSFIESLQQSKNLATKHFSKPGFFFKGIFELDKTADTYIDMSNYKKGVVFVNGHNLGRYWDIGPQKRLFCPAPFLKKGKNEIVVFDLHETEAKNISGKTTLE